MRRRGRRVLLNQIRAYCTGYTLPEGPSLRPCGLILRYILEIECMTTLIAI